MYSILWQMTRKSFKKICGGNPAAGAKHIRTDKQQSNKSKTVDFEHYASKHGFDFTPEVAAGMEKLRENQYSRTRREQVEKVYETLRKAGYRG
jgi:hypothetical protein